MGQLVQRLFLSSRVAQKPQGWKIVFLVTRVSLNLIRHCGEDDAGISAAMFDGALDRYDDVRRPTDWVAS